MAPGRGIVRTARTLVVATLVAFAALLLFMISFQTELLFPVRSVPAAGALPPGSGRLELKTPAGETLHGVHLPPAVARRSRLLVLGFGGNAWNGQEVATYLHHVFPEADVIAFHYRGYRPSTGSPSADALLQDAPLVLEAALERTQPTRAVAIGFSIGSGVAASLAKKPGINGLVLVTPFDSLKAVAADLYPWLPIGPFFRHEIDAAGFLHNVSTPVAILAAEDDGIIPPARTRMLRSRISNLKFDQTIAGAGHNDIYGREDFHIALRKAVDAVAPE